MIAKNKIYYCNECKKVTANINEIFFVEQSRFRGFCSEECITKFYTPMISYLKREEDKLRKEYLIEEFFNFDQKTYEGLIEKGISNPAEIWVDGEDLSEEYFCLISKNEQLGVYVIILTLFFENTPSLILFETVTKNDKIVEHYRNGRKINPSDVNTHKQQDPHLSQLKNERDDKSERGEKSERSERGEINDLGDISDINNSDEWSDSPSDNQERHQQENNFNIPPELIRLLESKKAQLLTHLIKDRSPNDISVDQYNLYDYCLQETIENPDEVYRLLDSGKDILLTYIKVFSKENISFYYLVICLQHSHQHTTEENYLIPIISFPTIDGELYRKYKKGEKIEGTPIS
ncbi:MAG: hypothetical protein HQK49_19170 [Oligoflexia bacterium]|nr:hypothetical protein [Oligoflexia bacterium]